MEVIEIATIMVIDDEEDILFIVKRILDGMGHKTIMASSGKEALEKLKEEIPDLILLDIMMPYLDGWETLKRIRDRDELKNIPVSMLTAKSLTPETSTRIDIKELVDYIEKPFTKETLLKKVNDGIIKDLISIAEKRAKMRETVKDEVTLNSYEIAARLERLHKSIYTNLVESLGKIEDPAEVTKVQNSIQSHQQSIDLFRGKRESIEQSIGI
jgi:CheY-like chemotaxis protein